MRVRVIPYRGIVRGWKFGYCVCLAVPLAMDLRSAAVELGVGL